MRGVGGDVSPSVLLVHTSHRTGWFVELQRDQEDMARASETHRCERTDWSYCTELVAVGGDDYTKRMPTILARR